MAWVGSNSRTPPSATSNNCDGCKNPIGRISPVLVESDSFGAEYAHLCEGCKHKAKAERDCRPCERCKKVNPAAGLIPMRDVLGEGMDAPTHYYCPDCHKMLKELEEREIAREDAYYASLGLIYDDYEY